MLDIVSYILGKKSATGSEVRIENGIMCIDDGYGHITIIDIQRTITLDGNITVTDDGSGNVLVQED